jgi:hypothetical protein
MGIAAMAFLFFCEKGKPFMGAGEKFRGYHPIPD